MRRLPSHAPAAVALLLALCASLHAAPVAAQGFSIVEMGTRKNAMGAVVGRPDDPSAVYHNPAGLTLQQGTRLYLSVGYVMLNTSIHLQPWQGSDKYLTEPVTDGFYPETSPSTFAAIPMLVLSSNLWSDKLVGALSFYVPNAAGASFPADSVARYHLVDSYIVAGFATLSLAYQPLDWLSVGAGVSLVYVRISAQRFFFPVVDGMDLGAFIGGKSEMELTGEDIVPAFNLGVLLRPFKQLTIGMTVLSPYEIALEGDVAIKFGDDAATDEEGWYGTHTTEVNAPWILFFGANLDLTKWLEVGGEFRYYFTSMVRDQHTTVEGIALIKELITPKNLRDYYQVSGGVNIKPQLNLPVKLELMAGLHYESSSAPRNTITVEQPSFAHYGIHLGVRASFARRYRLGLAYWHYEYMERRGKESLTIPPTNFVGSGNADGLTLILEVLLSQPFGG